MWQRAQTLITACYLSLFGGWQRQISGRKLLMLLRPHAALIQTASDKRQPLWLAEQRCYIAGRGLFDTPKDRQGNYAQSCVWGCGRRAEREQHILRSSSIYTNSMFGLCVMYLLAKYFTSLSARLLKILNMALCDILASLLKRSSRTSAQRPSVWLMEAGGPQW